VTARRPGALQARQGDVSTEALTTIITRISEAAWQRTVVEIAQWNRWGLIFHAPANRPINGHVQNMTAGFPDLCMVRGRRLLFVELKRERGRTTAAQREWLAALVLTGAETAVWRPSDLEEVQRVLA
jgi:hypothetical protein